MKCTYSEGRAITLRKGYLKIFQSVLDLDKIVWNVNTH
jgi:hypothetical protein